MTMLSKSLFSPPAYYASSPFDTAIVGKNTEFTAIAVGIVFGILCLAGIIGHCCVLAFVACCRRCSGSPIYSALVILGNLAAAHLVFVVTCIPAAAYESLMELVTSEWIFGDINCRLIPCLKLFLLGVTTFAFIAFAINRFCSAGKVDKVRENDTNSKLRGACKMLVLWIGALLLASPEFLMMKTTPVAAPLSKDSNMPFLSDNLEVSPKVLLLTKQQYWIYRNSLKENDDQPSKNRKINNGNMPEMVFPEHFAASDNLNTTVYVQYEICEIADSWNETFPHFVHVFMVKYVEFRHWWLLVFYFFLPICLTLLFALLISRRLALALQETGSETPALFTGSYYVTSGNDAGTLTSQREPQQVSLIDANQYRSNSLASNHTNMSDANYQQRGGYSLERQVAHANRTRRLSPVMSREDLHDASPTVVVSNGSIRTVDSFRRLPELSPQSPFAPSLAGASGVSVLSLAMSNTGGGTVGATSLPPHGHRRSIKRNSRSSKLTTRNVNRERALNSVLVALILAFTLTQLPIRVITILFHETTVLSLLETSHAELIMILCNYLAHITFILNPIVFCFSYKLYRRFLVYRCCAC